MSEASKVEVRQHTPPLNYGRETEISTIDRHDPCVGIRAVPIGKARVACVIADHYLRLGGQIGDNPAWPFPPPAR
ncbi:MAG TPA: chorismate synthase [Stellaceae bacterium]|nr:chorismate synthase [Stellaceae bacterium]